MRLRRGKDSVLVAIPSEIAEEIYGEEREAKRCSCEFNQRIAAEYEAHCAAVCP